MEITFEPLKEKHRSGIITILNYYTENSFAAYPDFKLSDGHFDMLLENAKKYPAYVMKRGDGDIIGFCMLRPYNPLPTFRETAEITYFISRDYVGQGLGYEALRRLEGDAKKLGIRNILASIVSLNETSLRFHQKNGFYECGCFAGVGQKFGEVFDIVWMQKVI